MASEREELARLLHKTGRDFHGGKAWSKLGKFTREQYLLRADRWLAAHDAAVLRKAADWLGQQGYLSGAGGLDDYAREIARGDA